MKNRSSTTQTRKKSDFSIERPSKAVWSESENIFRQMRLLTHNLLQCNRKGCTGGFPLKVNASSTDFQESEFNPEFIKAMLSKLEYSALVETAQSLDVNLLPPSFDPAVDLSDENFLKAVHDTISDFHVLEGSLVCPACSREFPITKGIPNMLLTPEEI